MDVEPQRFGFETARTSGHAVGALILSFFGCPGAILAIIVGIQALKEIARERGRVSGRGFAIAGIVLGALQILAVPIIAAIAIPNLLAARKAANEASAMGSCRTVFNAQQVFRDLGRSGTTPPTFARSLRDLYDPDGSGDPRDGSLTDHVLALTHVKAGYVFGSAPGRDDGECSGGGALDLGREWEIFASPVDPGNTGDHYFYISSDGAILRTSQPNPPHPRAARPGVWEPVR